MANDRNLHVKLTVDADTKKAQQDFQQLQNTLKNIAQSSIGGTSKELQEASKAALELGSHLEKAFNANTGHLDLSKFNASLTASGKNLDIYIDQLKRVGPEGQQAFLQLAQSIASADAPLIQVNSKLNEFLGTLKNTARWQISSSILHGFMGALQSAYGYAQDLNESLNNIQIVTQHSNEYMAEFAQKANKAAQALSTTTTKYTDASLIYYQQGLNDAEVEKRTAVTIKMANAARESAEVVSQELTSVWNNFYDGSKSLEYYADVMTKLGAETASSSAEIADGLQKFASIGKTVGLSYEYAASALATITATTRESADTVGNALKSLFSRIQGLKLGETLEDGVDLNKYSAAIEKVGVSVLDANGELRDMDQILDDLIERWDGLDRAQQTALAQTVAGQRQYAQFMTLMNQGDFFKENVQRAYGSEGSLQEQSDIYASGWEAARDRVKAAAEDIYSSLINDKFFINLNGFLEKALNSISGLIDGFGGLKGIILTIGSLFAANIANKIPDALNQIKTDAMILTGQAGKIAQQQQASLQEKIVSLTSNSDSEEYNLQIEKLGTISRLKADLASKEKDLTAAQREEYNILLKAVDAEFDRQKALAKTVDEKKNNAEQNRQEIENQIANNSGLNNSQKSWGYLQLDELIEYEEKLGNINEIQLQASNLLKDFGKTGSESFSELKEKTLNWMKSLEEAGQVTPRNPEWTRLKQDIENNTGDVNQLKDSIREINSDSFEGLAEKADGSAISIEDVKAQVLGLKEQLINKGVDENLIDALIGNEQDYGQALTRLKLLRKQIDNYENDLPKIKGNVAKLFGSGAALAMSFSAQLTSVNRAFEVFGDTSSTNIQKVTAVIATLTTTVNMGRQAFKLAGEASKIFGFSLAGPVGIGIGVAVAGLTALSVILGKQSQDAKKAREELEKHAETAKKAAEESQKRYDEYKNEQKENEDLLKSYEDLLEQYKETGQGKEALTEAALAVAKAFDLENAAIDIALGKYDSLITKAKDATAAEVEHWKTMAQTNLTEQRVSFGSSYNAANVKDRYKVSSGRDYQNSVDSEILETVQNIEGLNRGDIELLIEQWENAGDASASAFLESFKQSFENNPNLGGFFDTGFENFENEIQEKFGDIGKGSQLIFSDGSGNQWENNGFIKDALDAVGLDYLTSAEGERGGLTLNFDSTGADAAIESYEKILELKEYILENSNEEDIANNTLFNNLKQYLLDNQEAYENVIAARDEAISAQIIGIDKSLNIESEEDKAAAIEQTIKALEAEGYAADIAKEKTEEYFNTKYGSFKGSDTIVTTGEKNGGQSSISDEELDTFWEKYVSEETRAFFADKTLTLDINSEVKIKDDPQQFGKELDNKVKLWNEQIKNSEIQDKISGQISAVLNSGFKSGMNFEELSNFKTDSGIDWGSIIDVDGFKVKILEWNEFLSMTESEQQGYLETLGEQLQTASTKNTEIIGKNLEEQHKIAEKDVEETARIYQEKQKAVNDLENLEGTMGSTAFYNRYERLSAEAQTAKENWEEAAAAEAALADQIKSNEATLEEQKLREASQKTKTWQELDSMSLESGKTILSASQGEALKAEIPGVEAYLQYLSDGRVRVLGDSKKLEEEIHEANIRITNATVGDRQLNAGNKVYANEYDENNNKKRYQAKKDVENIENLKNQGIDTSAFENKEDFESTAGYQAYLAALDEYNQKVAGSATLLIETYDDLEEAVNNGQISKGTEEYEDWLQYLKEIESAASNATTATELLNAAREGKIGDRDKGFAAYAANEDAEKLNASQAIAYYNNTTSIEDRSAEDEAQFILNNIKYIQMEESELSALEAHFSSLGPAGQAAYEQILGTLDLTGKSLKELENMEHVPKKILDAAKNAAQESTLTYIDSFDELIEKGEELDNAHFIEGFKQQLEDIDPSNIQEAYDALNQAVENGEITIEEASGLWDLIFDKDPQSQTLSALEALEEKLDSGRGKASDYAAAVSQIFNGSLTENEAIEKGNANLDKIGKAEVGKDKNFETEEEKQNALNDAVNKQASFIGSAEGFTPQMQIDALAELKAKYEELGGTAPMVFRNIASAASDVFSSMQGLDLKDQIASLRDFFGDVENIDPNNLIILNQLIADLIMASSDASFDTLEEKISGIIEELGETEGLEYLRNHIQDLLNATGDTTEDHLQNLNSLLEQGIINSAQYSSELYKVLEQSDYDAETQQYLANSAYQTEIAAAEEKKPERPEQEDYDLDTKRGQVDYNFDMQSYQAAYQQYKEDIDSAQQSYANWVKTIDATEFKSFDKLLDFFSAIPEGIDVSKQLAEVYRDYGDQFENAATEAEALDKALRSGNEAQIQQAQVAYESAVRAGEAAAQYGLNAEYLEVLSDHIRELNPDLADSLEVVNQLAVEQARLNVAMEDINDNGDKYVKTFEELSEYGKESVLANSDLSKSYEGMRKTVANMLNVSEDFADELLNNKENAEDFAKALKGDEKAIQNLNKVAAKETIHKLGLDDDDFLNGVDSALAHLDELPEGKEIELNVNAEGYDETVANLITKMAEAENAIGGTITDLQEDLQGVDLGVEFELVPPEEIEAAKANGDLLVEAAGDIADRAYSAMEGGTEAEVNTETTETKDEVEPPPDQVATVTQEDGWISSMTGGGGTAGEGGTGMNPVEVMNKPVTFPSVKYNATPETPETVEKADTVNTYRVKKATPTNAGNVSHSNKTNRGGGGCFAAGTLISTNQGYKKIEDIQVGDIVLSYSLKNNQNEYSKVLQTMIHKITGNMYFIYVDGDVIESTEIHKFLIIRGNKAEWIAASDLKVSDLVYFADGTLHKIEMIKVKEKALTVYNFEVDGNHNYYVGNNQILVHNKGGGCFIAGTLVMAKEGYKNIEDIQKGDIVLSFNEIKNQNEYSKVLNTMTHIVNENIYTLYIEDEKLIVTGIHRFLITRKRAKGWVHASDLLIGDLVLFADGTWHKIHKIDVNIELKIVYNFEVSKNHNYYVGKNQILAHNKGRRGGGGSRPTGSAKVRAAAAHKEHEERYHVLDKKLGTLADSYKDVTSAKDRAFGSKHLKNIESEINLLEKEIAVQKDYRKEVEKFLKIDKASISKADKKGLTAAELKDYEDRKASYQAIDVGKIKFKTKGKGNKWTAKETEINTKADVSGYGGAVNFDANGNITNIEQLKEAATAKYNQAAQDYAKNHVDIGDISTKNKKKWKAEVKRQANITNEWNKAQAMYEQYMANLDKYEETLALKRQKITEAIEKEVNLIQAKLEKTSYQVEVKANIDDMSLKIINHALDMMGDKARNATARLGQLAEQLKTLNSTSSKMDRNGKKSNTGPGALSDNVWAISDILSNVTSSYKTITDNNGDIQYFNKENAEDSDYLNGNDLVKKMMEGGKSAEEVVKIIGKQQNITKDQFEKMMEYATSELERIQQMKEIRLQMFDIMSQTYDEETEKMDRLLDKQSFYMERANGYKNVLDIIGRANFAYNETKYNNGREAGRDLEEQIDNALLTQSQERIKTIDKEKQNQESLRKLSADGRTNAQNFIKALEATPDTLKDLDEDQKKIYDANFTKWSGYSDQQKKDAIEQWKQDIDAFDEQIQKADDKIDELTLEKQTAFENALTLTEENWERAMERAKEAFEQAMAGAASSLELLLDGLDRYDKTHSTMVADYEKVYQLRNLELQAQESIDKANDPKIKRELLSIQEEITAASTQDKKMSQYELDYLRQKLELKEAEAALEDAQKAKTQVSLTRDNEGNFGYVYTADDAAVDDAEKNYADKIYEMRKTNQEYIQSLQTELTQAQQDAINAIMEINGRKDLTPEEREAEIAKISEDYHTLHTNLIDQFNLALANSNDVFGQYSELYSQITGDTMALNVDYVKDFSDTQYSIQTGWKNTQQVADAFGDQMNTLLGEGGTLSKINAAYEANNKTTFENAGQNISTFAKDSIEALTGEDGLNKAVQSLTGDMKTLGDSAADNFGKVLTEVQKIEKDFTTYIGAMETSVTNLASALRDAAKAMAEIEDVAATVTTTDDNNDDNNDDKKNVPSGGRKKYKYYGSRGKKVRKTIRTARQANRLSYKAAKAVLSRKQEDKIKKQYRTRSAQKRAMIKKAKAIVKKQLKTNKFAGVKIRFDTGGYTGDWNGNDGRVAMLHKKEMVLNQQDTSNILSAVGMIRDIAQKIDLNALSQSGALSSGISGINGVSNGTLEQEVHITAEFPNATDRNEISEAFNNIIGLAAQYANR